MNSTPEQAKRTSSFVKHLVTGAFFAIFLYLAPPAARAQSPADLPANISKGLRELIAMHQQAQAKGLQLPNMKEAEARLRQVPGRNLTHAFRFRADSANRVLVNFVLDGSVSAEALKTTLQANGANVVAGNSAYRRGVLSAYISPGAAAALARTPGVQSILLVHRPLARVGRTTSQGTTLIRSDIANRHGTDGRGVTVGILSDSFNTSSAFGVLDTALSDVVSNDLPNTTAIPGGEGLKFLIELDPNIFGPDDDEGRAMAQIVHDVAPGAALCFATGFVSDVDFADNILTLRTDPGCNADVIVDDVSYEDEPFFSDGMLAQAVDEVAHSTTLPGHPVAYFSSAGNSAGSGYSSDLRIIPNNAARAKSPAALGINLNTIPADIDSTGGFHNIDPNGGTLIAQDFFFTDGTDISFQWDDPFDLIPSGITTGLNLLFFDPATGNFLFAANDDAFQINRPIQNFSLNTGQGPGTFAEVKMVVARTGQGKHLARRIKYVAFGGLFDLNGLNTAQTPVTFGHSSANGANSVAAINYNTDPAFFGPPAFRPLYESFSSPGPVVIAFDKDGNRLKRAEVRQKPDISAPDGVNTTFFPEVELFGPGVDIEGDFGFPDGFPNFFGTSAAAPHAAGAAALIIQKAGGPGALPPLAVNLILKASAPARDADLFTTHAIAASGGAVLAITAQGDDTFTSDVSAQFFRIDFHSVQHQSLQSVTIDLSGTGMIFDPVTFPLTVGATTGPALVSATPLAGNSAITLTFSGFSSGNSFSFGIARGFNFPGTEFILHLGGTSAEDVVGARVSATVTGKGVNSLTGVFQSTLGKGYRIYDGFGMIDADQAVRLVSFW